MQALETISSIVALLLGVIAVVLLCLLLGGLFFAARWAWRELRELRAEQARIGDRGAEISGRIAATHDNLVGHVLGAEARTRHEVRAGVARLEGFLMSEDERAAPPYHADPPQAPVPRSRRYPAPTSERGGPSGAAW